MEKLTNKNIENKLEEVSSKAKKESKKAFIGVEYDAKALKFDFDKSREFKTMLTAYYFNTKTLAQIMSYVKNNNTFYQNELKRYEDKEPLTKEDIANIDTINANIRKINACGRVYRRSQNTLINEICSKWAYDDERILKAYVSRLVNPKEWKNALNGFFTQYSLSIDDKLFNHIDTLVGVKSASLNNKGQGVFIDNYKGKALYMLLTDIMLDLAIKKQKIAWSCIDNLKGEMLVEIEEFKGYVTVEELTIKSTINNIKTTLDLAGLEYSANARKSELFDIYKKAVKDGTIVEY